jgi:serine/threonine protein kinase
MDHPALPRCIDVIADEAHQRAACVLELPLGMTLRRAIRHGRIGPKDAIEIGLELAEALEVLHAKDFVHGDLRPENIVLVEPEARTAGHTVKLADIGLGLTSGASRAYVRRLAASGVFAAYRAPEQAKGDRVSASSDVFALAAIVYELLDGKPYAPADAWSDETIRAPLCLPKPTWRSFEEDDRLMQALFRALDPDPRKRISLAELKAVFAEVARGAEEDVDFADETISEFIPDLYADPEDTLLTVDPSSRAVAETPPEAPTVRLGPLAVLMFLSTVLLSFVITLRYIESHDTVALKTAAQCAQPGASCPDASRTRSR